MRHVAVFHFACSMSMENVLCCFCVNDQHWLHYKPKFFSPLTLLAMIFFCPTTATPALDDFLVSLSSAQSESEKTVTSELMSPENLDPVSLCLQVPNESRFSVEKLCCEGSDILWHNSFTAKVLSA